MATAAAGTLLGRVQAHVANLAAGAHNARYHIAVNDNAAAHAGTDGDHHHVLHAPWQNRARPRPWAALASFSYLTTASGQCF